MSPVVSMLRSGLGGGLLLAFALALALLGKSFKDFSQTGPQLRDEIHRHFRLYALWAVSRLTFWVFLISSSLASIGVLLYIGIVIALDFRFRFGLALVAAGCGVIILTGLQFCRHLLYLPASIAASYHYRKSRLYPLWQLLTPSRLRWASAVLLTATVGVLVVAALKLFLRDQSAAGLAMVGVVLLVLLTTYLALYAGEPRAVVTGRKSERPNVIMIGSDTLRADRLGAAAYRRNLTPFIDSLGQRGTQFTDCYVPCARTAPSLISLLTGTWPHVHGVRDNFVADPETSLPVATLPEILNRAGYISAAIGDWSGGDLCKFPLGFQRYDLPRDQWNIKYLIRQGPKDLRLFLSLFTHNRFGKWVLPELYYLAGVPLTRLVGRDTNAMISEFAERGQPFFLDVFVSTTHPPFGSEYPYYLRWADPKYVGESKFLMARLTDPWEIIRRQGDSKKEFDLDQILDLYDGCVTNFDDEVKRIVDHITACGLSDNTIVVIYSDHGMEFFEHDTWGQGNSVRGDFSSRIPLIVVDPRIKGNPPCKCVVRSIDVAPTLLDLLGIEIPSTVSGVSLVPYLKGNPVDMNLPAFAETGIWLTDVPGQPANHLRYPNLLDLLDVPDKRTGTLAIKKEYQEAVVAAKDRMIRLGPWKLTFQPTTDGPLFALYDIANDRDCRHDVAATHPAIVAELKGLLLHWMNCHPSSDVCATKTMASASGSA